MALIGCRGLRVAPGDTGCAPEETRALLGEQVSQEGWKILDEGEGIFDPLEATGFAVLATDLPPPYAREDLVHITGDRVRVRDLLVRYADVFGADPDTLSCGRASRVSFTMEFDHSRCKVTVLVKIHLTEGPGRSVRNGWRDAILSVWSDHYDLVVVAGSPPCDRYRILVRIEWVATVADADYIVVPHDDECPPQSRISDWYTDSPDKVVAHEFGHMLGNDDEYDEEACPDRVVRDSIMGDWRGHQRAKARHYEVIRLLAEKSQCAQFEVVEARQEVDSWPNWELVWDEASTWDVWC